LPTSKPVSSPAPVAPQESSRPARRSIVPLVIAGALLIGLGIGIAAMLGGRGHPESGAAVAPPPALTTLPSASASGSAAPPSAP
jgi:hypothetical protein